MRKIAFLFLCSLFALVATPALAADFAAPSRKTGDVVLSTTATYKNLYTAGSNVTVNSTVSGDAYIAGGSITIDGPVESDVVVAGGTVVLNNAVGGDVRAAGGTLTINSEVAGDVVVAGGKISIGERAKIGGDLIIAGGTVAIDAPVAGKLWASGGDVTINNTVTGPIMVKGAEMVTFGAKAVAKGTISIQAQKEPVVMEGAQVGTIDFKVVHAGRTAMEVARAAVFGGAVWILAYLLVALAAVWAAPKRIARFVTDARKNFWANLGIGVATAIVAPIVAIALLLVLVGYQLAFVLFTAYLFAMVLAWVLAVLWTGSVLFSLMKKHPHISAHWQTAVLGAFAFTLVRFIPVIGSIFCMLVFLSMFGQLVRATKNAVVEHEEVVAE